MSFSQRKSLLDAWLLTDGHIGNLRQADALARALGMAAGAPELRPRAPWSWLAPRLLGGAGHAFGASFARQLQSGPLPPLAIGCGRQGALATRLLRARGVRTVQILDPRVDPRHWDVVIAPEHDGLHGGNVITLTGSLSPVDPAWLADAAARFPALLALPQPRVVLLVGGPTRHAPWTLRDLEALLARLREHVIDTGGSLLASVSRRTPTGALACLRTLMPGIPGVLWDGRGDANPYPGMLAAADRIVCTPDSVNLLSEACATPAPVFVLDPQRAQGRVGRFVRSLELAGRIRPADTPGLPACAVTPLQETARVAAQVRQRMEL